MRRSHQSRIQTILYLIILTIAFTGCAKIKHLRELLVLKGLSDEQTEVSHYIEVKNERFDMLYSMVESGDIERYDNTDKILRHFGNPIRSRPAEYDARHSEWYYRVQTEYFGMPAVYLYFDEANNLISWKAEGGEDEQRRQETP